MRKLIYFFIITIGFMSCSSDDDKKNTEYKFVSEYTATVIVGGVIGITERTFEVGEVYSGVENSNNIITIRIAEPSKLNEDCPNSWCFQELLDVPDSYLKLLE
ncbi:hypothetical protein AAFN75_10225 [Algibacter sp. AS12]|uniref:hypothetical protein n=1 Tax=Algibacter sp. AS12 TaxID=3135773 RepID=UPI00398B66A3